MLASGNLDAAAGELGTALEASEQLGTVKLSWDIHRSLMRLAREAGHPADATRHEAAARDLRERIKVSLRGADLQIGFGEPD